MWKPTELTETKMEAIKLCDSNYCRLCAEQNENSTDLFIAQENSESLSHLVNKYLPLKVENDSKLPRSICPGCLIQLEATKSFMDLIAEGQAKLRDLYRRQQDIILKQEKHRQQLQEVLQSVNPNTTVKTYTIQSDETGLLQSFIQIYSEGPLFPPSHELSLRAEGLDRPKRRRGRPPKSLIQANQENEEEELKEEPPEEEEEGNDTGGRRKRKIRPPAKFQGVIQGEELEKVWKQEGVMCEDDRNSERRRAFGEENIIGRIQSKDGEDLGEPVYTRVKPQRDSSGGMKKSQIKKTPYTCSHCHKGFMSNSRYLLHLESHNLINFLCSNETCNFESNDENYSRQHKEETGHTILSVIECSSSNPELVGDMDVVTTNLQQQEPSGGDLKLIQTDPANTGQESQTSLLSKASLGTKKPCVMKVSILNPKKPKPVEKKYPCNLCDKVALSPSSLLYHKENEHDEKRYACLKCDKTFRIRQQLLRHQTAHSQERPYGCTKCNLSFKTQSNLTNHQLVHSGVKNFVCHLCPQRYAHKASLLMHKRWHNGEKPYECEFCQKRFAQRGNLIEHKRIHTGEKPFCCEQCGSSFTTSSQFNLHMKKHKGDKPWICEICSKAFLYQESYKVHIRRHLNERPYKCKLCVRSFPEMWALKRHQRIHTQEKPYKCELCGKMFADKSNLNKHLKVHSTKHEPTSNESLLLDNNSALMDSLSSDLNLKKLKMMENDTLGLHLTQLIDPQGNPISITTVDGQTIAILTDRDKNQIKGLLPDGSLVPFDLTKDILVGDQQSSDILDLQDDGLISTKMDMIQNEVQTLDTNMQLITTDDGQEMCLITYGAMDGNAVINQEIDSSLFLTPM